MDDNKISVTPIGIVHSPFKDRVGTPIQPKAGRDIKAEIEVYPEFEEGLDGVEGFSHLVIVFHFHLSADHKLKAVPYLSDEEKGIFAIRGPNRPNRIGVSVVRLEKREGNILHIKDVDMLDGTPVLDIKPYVPSLDPEEEVRKGWLEDRDEGFRSKRADDRF